MKIPAMSETPAPPVAPEETEKVVPSQPTYLPWVCNGQFVFSRHPDASLVAVARAGRIEDAQLIAKAVNEFAGGLEGPLSVSLGKDPALARDEAILNELGAARRERDLLHAEVQTLSQTLEEVRAELEATRQANANIAARHEELLALARSVVAAGDEEIE